MYHLDDVRQKTDPICALCGRTQAGSVGELISYNIFRIYEFSCFLVKQPVVRERNNVNSR